VLTDAFFFMRFLRRLVGLSGCLLGCLMGSLLALPSMAGSVPLPALTPASIPALKPDQVGTLSQARILPGGDIPPGDDAPWQAATLPHRWATTHGVYEGTMWYRFHVKLMDAPGQPWAVYLPRAVMNAQVWVNGAPMAFSGSMNKPVTRNWYTPLLTQVPMEAWHAGLNTIDVRVVSGFASHDGLAPIQVGPLKQLDARYKRRVLVQVDAMNFGNVALFSLGVFMLIIWSRDRAQRAIGFQGLAAMLWGLGVTALAAPNPLLWGSPWWETWAYVVMAWGMLMMCLFFWRFVGTRWLWADVVVYGLMVVMPVLAFTWPSVHMTAALFGVILLVLMASQAQALYTVIRQKRVDRGWLLFGCAIVLPAAFHDLALEFDVLPLGAIYLMPYVGPVMMASIFYVLVGDYARSRRALNRLNDNLSTMVARREVALRESFERLSELERVQAVSDERSRILRDMHDGVGTHLTSALRQLQSPRNDGVDLGLVTQTLRDSLDQLKLSIDALSLTPGDVVGLLASLRFRITPRLKAAGLTLVWDVQALPAWPNGQAHALRQLQYILFEGLSNALQHSGASRLTLSARGHSDRLQVSLTDNGSGWDASCEGQGLQAMRARASVIGAGIAFIKTAEGGLELRVTLPLQADKWVDLSSAA
jgi:hypothetical protein